MNARKLQTLLELLGFKVDSWHGGAGPFRDLYIGIGADYPRLASLVTALRLAMPEFQGDAIQVTRTTNPEHPDYGKPFVEIKSFHWTED